MKQNVSFISLKHELRTLPKYKHGKQEEWITFQDFQRIMEHGRFVKPLRDRSFLAYIYWIGPRRSGALERVREDFKVEKGVLKVDLPPKKHGLEAPPIEIPADLPYVDLIIEKVKKTRRSPGNPEGLVWNMSATTAWRIVKRVMPKHYPHFFRGNRATSFLNDPTTTTPQMMTWFRWKSHRTVDNYILKSKRHIQLMAPKLRQEIEQ